MDRLRKRDTATTVNGVGVCQRRIQTRNKETIVVRRREKIHSMFKSTRIKSKGTRIKSLKSWKFPDREIFF